MALLGAGAAWAGHRAAVRLAARPAGSGDAGGDRYHRLPRQAARDHHPHHGVRAGPARLRRDAVQCARQSDAVAHHAQHAARGHLDLGSGPDPGGIAIPSFKLCSSSSNTPKADLTIKATGKQWYWTYSIRTASSSSTRCMRAGARTSSPASRGCCVDNELVVPVNKVVRVQTTGADVIHAFAVPSFGIKIDAIPGRLNETWFKADARRHLLRPVLGAVRQGPRLHADRGAGGERAGIHRLARGGEEEIRAATTTPPDRRSRRPRRVTHRKAERAGASRTTSVEGLRTMAWQHGGSPRRARRSRAPSDRMAPLRLFDQPQGHRHDVPGVRDHGGRDRRRSCRSRSALELHDSRHADLPRRRTSTTCSPPRTA